MEFLVHVTFATPEGLDPERLSELHEAERARSRELQLAGVLKRLWRDPGRRATWGLWEVADVDGLHAAVSSLPFWAWMEVEVHALAKHPNAVP